LREASARSRALLVLLNSGHPELADLKSECPSFFAADDHLPSPCVFLLGSGKRSDLDTALSGYPVHPELWATRSGRTFNTLSQLWATGNDYDKEDFVLALRYEICAILDGVDDDPDGRKAKQAQRAGFIHAISHDQALSEEAVITSDRAQAARASQTEEADDAQDLLPILEAWARGEGAGSRIFALLGSYGAGKPQPRRSSPPT